MQMLLIRHALPVRIEDSDGPADPELSEIGHQQAGRLAEWLAVETIDAVWSSPLRRARETAAPLASALGLEVVIDEDLAEFDREADFYIPIEELKAEGDPRWDQLVSGDWSAAEEAQAFEEGVGRAMERVITANPSRTVAVVCHGGVINAYLADVLGLAEPRFFMPTYTGISRVMAARSGERSISTVNEAAHLRGL
jgi:broad specificity phosphatase PhoE